MAKKKTTVYVVTAGCYSDYNIQGIFSTRSKAQEFIDNCKQAETCWNKDFNDIDEIVLDQELAQITYTRYRCALFLKTGAVIEEATDQQECFGIPNGRAYICHSVPCDNNKSIVRAESHKSAKHALKLAVEARQAWLRSR